MTSELELITAAVTGALTGGAVKPLLAPFEALGDRWRAKTAARLARVDERAAAKRRGRAGGVNERVAFKALTEAAFTDDVVVADYLGGVLAAGGPDDDAGAAVVALIGRLAAVQLRLHHVCYRAVWAWATSPTGGDIDMADTAALGYSPLFLPLTAVVDALGWDATDPATTVRLGAALRVLAREDLVGDQRSEMGPSPERAWLIADAERLGAIYQREIPDTGVVFQASPAGIELFLWGIGAPDRSPGQLRAAPGDLVANLDDEVPVVDVVAVTTLPSRPPSPSSGSFVARPRP